MSHTQTDHCIELLRQAAVCRADTSLQTYKWTADDDVPQFDAHSPVKHSCVDWDALKETVKPRIVSNDEMKRLVKYGGNVHDQADVVL
ncbi:hypothetical protein RRF57_011382 [Xylaria bambusicola]|uniref:Uncharacterized protein n=1 Tax=Xylaria bambusicola TaxID=326684 RepID=A0AAN7UMP5_9PEZI